VTPGQAAYREHEPCAALAPYVDRLWVNRGTAGPRVILPDGCIDILVDLTRPEAPFVVGTMTNAALFEAGEHIDIVGVRFKPGGAPPFLRLSAGELTDRHHDQVPWLRIDPREPMASLERALLERLARIDDTPDRLIVYAVNRIAGSAHSTPHAGTPTIDELARETGYSRQYLGRRFRDRVGLSPKQLHRIARMQRAVIALQRDDRELAVVAVASGYFDQAHMNRDLRALASITPAAVRAARGGAVRPIASLYAR